jgi:hypothetical protein
MISQTQWGSLLNLTPEMFRRPDGLNFGIVQALDQFITIVGSRPVILSDFRPGDPKQHGRGDAIDAWWSNGIDPTVIWERALASRLFHGLGVYLNEIGAVSFHFDKRIERTPSDPALWGDLISHSHDADTGAVVRTDNYTTAQAVLDEIKKKRPVGVIVIAAILFALWFSRR